MRFSVGCRSIQFRVALLLPAFIALCAGNFLLAQAAQSSGTPPGLTLSVQSRLISEDILVTDAQGKPVHGLPQSAFHVFDEDRPEVIRSFEEGTPDADGTVKSSRPPLPNGVFSNINTADAHTVSEVLLIDSDDLVVEDQMFLLDQLRRAVTTLPPGLQVSVFCVVNGRPVQLRGFSTDRDDLRRSFHECLPVLTHAIDSPFQSGVEQLLTVAAYLQQTPGRKNILWFTGSFPLSLVSSEEQQPGGINPDYAVRQRYLHLVQEALAEARVSVYPVDVRGVITHGIAPPSAPAAAQTQTRDPSSTMKRTPTVAGPDAEGPAEQRQQMRELASITGGKAYMLNNLSEEVSEAFDLGVRAYTLTYAPSVYTTDESWHRVRITVDGGYHLSYRQGYLATWSGVPGGREGFRLEDGKKISTRLDPNRFSADPIHFTVKVAPQTEAGIPNAAKGKIRVALDFRIATDQVDFVHKDDRWIGELLIYAYAYDSSGKIKGGKLHELDTSLNDEQWQRAQHQQLPLQQVLDLPKDADYLLMAVRDKRSQRLGTFFLPMRVVRTLSAAPISPSTTSAESSPTSSTTRAK